LPAWISWPIRLVVYLFFLFILANVVLGIMAGRSMDNVHVCLNAIPQDEGGLKHARRMVACLEEKNSFLENWLMSSVHRTVDAMQAPKEFVGTWIASQPRCTYRHRLEANGEFTSEPMGCSLSGDTFHGVWGVYDNKMVWLSDEGIVWPPDINQMDVVDKDFFLLVERDGTRTKFSRVSEPALPSPPGSGSVAGSVGTVVVATGKADGSQIAGLQSASGNAGEEIAEASGRTLTALYLKRRGLEAPADEVFDEVQVEGLDGLSKILSHELDVQVRDILAEQPCKPATFYVYRKPGKQETIIETDCMVGDEYPMILAATRDSIHELKELDRFGFMYQSGELKAVTDINGDGHSELWLEGDVCECDGEDNESCDCARTTVVEER
jgi:hypothetical protein